MQVVLVVESNVKQFPPVPVYVETHPLVLFNVSRTFVVSVHIQSLSVSLPAAALEPVGQAIGALSVRA